MLIQRGKIVADNTATLLYVVLCCLLRGDYNNLKSHQQITMTNSSTTIALSH